jgi:hypothetical protein
LKDYLLAYNHFIPQRAIGHRSPIDALASWYDRYPEMFVRKVCNQAECDTPVPLSKVAPTVLATVPLPASDHSIPDRMFRSTFLAFLAFPHRYYPIKIVNWNIVAMGLYLYPYQHFPLPQRKQRRFAPFG